MIFFYFFIIINSMKVILIIMMISAVILPVCAEDVMKFAYPQNSPPYVWGDEEGAEGLIVQLVDEVIGKRMNITVSHAGYPWERANRLVQKGDVDALITYGPARTEWAYHSKEVFIELKYVLFVKKDSKKIEQLKNVKTIEDLASFKIVDELGSGWAKQNLPDDTFDVTYVPDFRQVYQMIARGRADVNINNPIVARKFIKELGLEDQIVELHAIVNIPFHLVIGKKSSFTGIIDQFDEVVAEMKKDGSLEAIIYNYQPE